MNNILSIRKRFGMSQSEFGDAIGVSQGNVSHYELLKQEVPPDVARRVIAAGQDRGIDVSFDDIYSVPSRMEASDNPTPGPHKSASAPHLLEYGEPPQA